MLQVLAPPFSFLTRGITILNVGFIILMTVVYFYISMNNILFPIQLYNKLSYCMYFS